MMLKVLVTFENFNIIIESDAQQVVNCFKTDIDNHFLYYECKENLSMYQRCLRRDYLDDVEGIDNLWNSQCNCKKSCITNGELFKKEYS